jgi:membrane-bound ClpP family serine protease
VLGRSRGAYRAWADWSDASGTKHAYFSLMTPGAALVAVGFFVVGAWVFGLLCVAITVIGVRVLTRRRTSV